MSAINLRYLESDGREGIEKSEIEIKEIAYKTMRIYNFDYFSLYMEKPYPLTKKRSYFISCFDNYFMINEGTHQLILNSLNNTSSISYLSTISWQVYLKYNLPAAWLELSSNGGESGYSTVFRTKNGEKVLCSFFRKQSASKKKIEDISKDENLFSKSILISIKFATLAMDKNLTSPLPLTSREVEILRWTSEGKTSSDIGCILNISTSTVNFHTQKALDKLAVPNKAAAIAKAICFNLI
ncbi:LuxR C-terminal-related transcriptional regulator [Serratia bockelmannii]|uniref:LuxR C-terminal-related transcriptional regulator n=1 Tax=Serratia bockelmannii TaxID=2703793 RepID=UPI00313F331D